MKLSLIISFMIFFCACSGMRSGQFVKISKIEELPAISEKFQIPVEEIKQSNDSIQPNSWIFVPHVSKVTSVINEKLSARRTISNQKNISKGPLSPIENYNLDFEWPLANNFLITSKYGMRRGRMHRGVDVGAPHGSEILASYDGKVTFSGWMRGYGLVVILKHERNFETVYAHASRVFLRKGKIVKKGQKLALVGNTGRSTGSHLHFEIRLNGEAIDPSDFFASVKLASLGLWPVLNAI